MKDRGGSFKRIEERIFQEFPRPRMMRDELNDTYPVLVWSVQVCPIDSLELMKKMSDKK